MDFPLDKKVEEPYAAICQVLQDRSGKRNGRVKKGFFFDAESFSSHSCLNRLVFGVDLIERCFSLKIFNLHPISLQRWVPKRPDFNKPKRYQYINNHTNNNHHEDVNTTLQGGPKRPDRRQVESHVRSSRGWRTPARD